MCDWYEVHGYRFAIRTTSESFGAWLRYALAAYLTEPTGEEEDTSPAFSIVVEDGDRGEDRIGRRYNILYLGTRDIARTLDLRFLARCLLRQIDSIGYRHRDDAVYLETGLATAGDTVDMIPTLVVPLFCKARRRAEKRGLYSPGGMVAALDLRTGELVAPRLSLEVPPDALKLLDDLVPSAQNGARDQFPIEDGERRTVGAVIGLDVRQNSLVAPRPRSAAVLDLAMAVRNRGVLGTRFIQPLAAMVEGADSLSVSWSNTNEMIEAFAQAATRS